MLPFTLFSIWMISRKVLFLSSSYIFFHIPFILDFLIQVLVLFFYLEFFYNFHPISAKIIRLKKILYTCS